jgi:60 kDa SS-A/Ro ribonucleoprotein
MASLNTRRQPARPPQGGVAPQSFEPSNTLRTHEGAAAASIPVEMQLRRSVCSCLLWEDTFYENGKTIADRIVELASQVQPQILAELAETARSHFNLRHVPLLLCSVLARTGSGSRLVGDTIAATIQRADEISEFVAVYAQVNGVAPNAVRRKLSAQVKKGLAQAFNKFDAFQLARYMSLAGEKKASIRGRDVMFMTHPVAKDPDQATLFKRIANKESVVSGGAGSWETELSAGKDKRETWERLLREEKIGYLALLRNLAQHGPCSSRRGFDPPGNTCPPRCSSCAAFPVCCRCSRHAAVRIGAGHCATGGDQ